MLLGTRCHCNTAWRRVLPAAATITTITTITTTATTATPLGMVTAALQQPLASSAQSTREQRRCFGYRSYDTSRRFAQRRRGEKATAPPTPDSNNSNNISPSIRRREGGIGVRPAQSAVQARKEAAMAFPETLPSGRPAQLNTQSQRLFFENRANVAEFAQQQQVDREYVRAMREAQRRRGGAGDSRFFTRASDYRDIGETDPYADVFGESASTHRLRTAAWQRQFEKENEGVELPYERTNVVARLAPNWFVRYFVNLRDKGGSDHLYVIVFCFVSSMSLLWFVGYMFYTAPSKARPSSEIR